MPSEPRLLAGAAPPPVRAYDADIVILSHHRPRETIAAIRSAAGQAWLDHHVIVLDQASPPGTRTAIASAIAGLGNVALYGIDENLGVPGGRNLATALGRGRTIISLDNDAIFSTGDIAARATARLAASPDLGAIGFRILAADGTSLDATSWGYPKGLRARAAECFTTTTFVGCGHALSRACFDGLGGYDPRLFFAWEEYEFARRAIAAGWRIEHHGDLTVIHAVSPESRVGRETGRWRHFVRNRLLIAHDWHGLAGMVPRGAIYLARGIATGRFRTSLGAVAEALRLARHRPRHRADARGRRYVRTNETVHRLPGPIRFIAAIGASDASAAREPPRAAAPGPSGRS